MELWKSHRGAGERQLQNNSSRKMGGGGEECNALQLNNVRTSAAPLLPFMSCFLSDDPSRVPCA